MSQSSILAVHPGALGDVIIFGRLLERLGADVTLVAGGEKGRLLEGLGVVRRAMDFDALPMHELFSDEPLESCLLPGLLGAHRRLISCFADSHVLARQRLAAACACGSAGFLPVRPPEGFAGHLLELWCDMLGLECDLAAPAAWPVPQAWRQAARAALADLGVDAGRAYAVIHPGAGSAKKCWPIDRFADLAAILRRGGFGAARQASAGPGEQAGHWQIVFVLGPVEMDLWGSAGAKALGGEFPVLAAPTLEVLAGVLAQAGAYVGNDSGASHLAGAVGAPTVALFGPTPSEQFAPLGPRVRTVQGQTLSGITVEQVSAVLAH